MIVSVETEFRICTCPIKVKNVNTSLTSSVSVPQATSSRSELEELQEVPDRLWHGRTRSRGHTQYVSLRCEHEVLQKVPDRLRHGRTCSRVHGTGTHNTWVSGVNTGSCRTCLTAWGMAEHAAEAIHNTWVSGVNTRSCRRCLTAWGKAEHSGNHGTGTHNTWVSGVFLVALSVVALICRDAMHC
jgi:hypothetical protein